MGEMSHTVVINYEAIAIECRSMCEVASKQLCQIDTLLHKIDETSQTLQNEETEGIKHQLKEHSERLRKRISDIIEQSNAVANKGKVTMEFFSGNEGEIVTAAQALSEEVDRLSTVEIARYETLLDSLLSRKIAEHNRDLRLRAGGTVAYNAEFSAALAKVDDEVLKSFIYLEWLDNKNVSKSFEELKQQAEEKIKEGTDFYFKRERKTIFKRIESEMRDAKLDEDTISAVLVSSAADAETQITEIQKKATKEIVSETVRKKTLKVIIECIESKGFIVDRKNIKLQRDKNQVYMVAKKVSGETAEFRVMLDGKFIYHFDGYEGQACQDDIQPFMKDLDEIYGIKVVEQKEIWKNPDKISTQKYQQRKINTNKS